MSNRIEPNEYIMKPDPLFEEDLDFEIEFFESLVIDHPNYEEALIQLGTAYAKKGYLDKSLEIDKQLVTIAPADPFHYYNLSCNYALLGKKKMALDTLERSVDLGYKDYDHLKKDPDLDGIRQSLRFRKILWKLLHLHNQDMP